MAFSESMDLAEIASRTGLSMRLLRYVFDHALLPAAKEKHPGTGSPRKLTPFEAFSVACAAFMMRAGLKRRLVQQTMSVLCRNTRTGDRRPGDPLAKWLRDVPLWQAFESGGQVALEVGDGVNLRMTNVSQSRGGAVDTGWVQVRTGHTLADGYRPSTWIGRDIGRLRDQLMGRQSTGSAG